LRIGRTLPVQAHRAINECLRDQGRPHIRTWKSPVRFLYSTFTFCALASMSWFQCATPCKAFREFADVLVEIGNDETPAGAAR